jgi:dCTP diphosphatase
MQRADSKPTSDAEPNAFLALRDRLRIFATERDWDQFHSPKNLAAALSVEAGELLEHFQWMSEAESRSVTHDRLDAISLELADVLLYLVRLADKLGVDLVGIAERKIDANAVKYPVDRARGNARKYTEL